MTTLQIMSVSNAIVAVNNEDAKYDSGTVTNGYGQVSGVYATVQKGTKADLDVDIRLITISQNTFEQWKSDVLQYFNREEREKLEENYGGFGLAGGFFAGGFGILFGGGDYNHYKNKSESFHTENNEKKAGFAKSVYNLTTSEFQVRGKLVAEGTSFIPVTVCVYLQVTKIKFNDGKELHVLSTDDVQAADKRGATEGVKTLPTKLNITPL